VRGADLDGEQALPELLVAAGVGAAERRGLLVGLVYVRKACGVPVGALRLVRGGGVSDYADFLKSKRMVHGSSGVEVDPDSLPDSLFPFQRDLTRWALRKGRAAIFADTGLGKTLMQLAWAQHAAERVLILAPLAVAGQTVREGARWGIEATYARSMEQSPASGITVTNYEMLQHFNVADFGAVVLDESSILKQFDGKTRTALIHAFAETPRRLCCTATPAPNDIAEIANHAEFLGVMTRSDMLASFFVHDDEGWRLKRHARTPFWRWLASWGMAVKRPSDIGYSDDGYALPPLTVERHVIPSAYVPDGQLFAANVRGIGDRSAVRRQSLDSRLAVAAELINRDRVPWIAWVGLNDEGRGLAEMIPDAVLIEGSDSHEVKQERLESFMSGNARVLITKPRIAGFGLNLQHCSRMVFVGLSDSYEQYYQSVRRCWRFGQSNRVVAHVVLTDPELPVLANVMKKETEAERMSDELMKHVAEYERAELAHHDTGRFDYAADEATGDGWRLLLGDSAELVGQIEPASLDLSVFSPPFSTLYTYSNTERDLGNSSGDAEFWEHMRFVSDGLFRAMKPGRIVCVHVAQTVTTQATHGVIGLKDFRGDTINHFKAAGFVYHGEVCIDKDPQAQAIRTHSKGLLFVQLRKDSSWLRPALADYILVFRAPGVNAVAIHPDITNEDWIEWARPIWYGIKESDTLNSREGRGRDDERHICALQLGTIERCIRLWSNPGETVFSPFAGIGSEGYEAIRLGRRFLGVELKPEYFAAAKKNLSRAVEMTIGGDLFSEPAEQVAP
jgi:DNA modification methylase